MADSDSGTHVTDISESLQDDFEATKEEVMLQQVTETGRNPSRDVMAQTTTVEIHGENTSRNKPNSVGRNQLKRRNSTGSTPQLIRHVTTSRAASPTHVMPNRTTSLSRAFHMPSQSTSQVRYAPSPARFMPNCSVSPAPSRRISSRASTPVRKLSSPASSIVSRDNKPAGRVSRRRSIPAGRVPNHATSLVAANVLNSPRRYRKLNGSIGSSRHLVPADRSRHLAGQKTVSYGGTLGDGDGAGFLRTIDSIPAHSGSRSAYDFAEANKRNRNNPKWKTRQTDFLDIELDVNDEEDTKDEPDYEKPWLPTGIYAVFLITLWTAVIRLVDSVEKNGPVACTSGEETRLWICAASFSLMQGLAEAVWQRKNLLKVIFSMSCLFGYFVISHIQPLSCRIGEDKVTEITKWQSAVNFFVSALLGINIYRHIQESIQDRKNRKEMSKRPKEIEESDMFEGLPEGVL